MTYRLAWMDAARGLGIILVVYGHVVGGLLVAHLIARGSAWMITKDVIYAFHMALFFFLAGLNVQHSLARGRLDFFKGKLWLLGYPYLLWSLVQLAVQAGLSRYSNNHVTLNDALGILWHPVYQFWFLYALLICHLVAMVLSRWPVLLMGLGLVTYCAAPYFTTDIINCVLHFFLFYALGLGLSSFVLNWQPPTRGAWFGLLAIWVLFGLAYAATYLHRYAAVTFVLWLAVSLLGIAGMIWTSKLISGPVLGLLTALGIMSMSIYVMHIIITAGVRILLVHVGVVSSVLVHVVFATCLGLMIPVLVHVMLKRMGLLTWFGLAPLKRRKA